MDFTSQYIPDVEFSEHASELQLDLIDLADLKARAGELMPAPDKAHRLRFNILIVVTKGEGKHFVDFKHIGFTSGSVFMLNRGQVHAFDFVGELQGTAVLYTDAFVETLHANMRIPFLLSTSMSTEFSPHLQIDGRLQQSTHRLLNELNHEVLSKTADEAIVMSLFSALLMMLGRERANPARALGLADAKKFARFMALIEQHFHQSREAAFYSEQLGVTYKTLNLLCKKVSGRTAKQHIDHYVVLEAKRRLLIDRMDIATVAFDLGFDEPTNFTKFFKRHTGMTPKQFF